MQRDLSQAGYLFLFAITATLFISIGLFIAKLVRPHKPNPEKLLPYESGEEPVGRAWNKFSIKYYIIALIFLLFEVELIFLFPWATIYNNTALTQAGGNMWLFILVGEVLLFIVVLAVGLAYVWVKGHLDWSSDTSSEAAESPISVVPYSFYQKVNDTYR